MKAYLFTVLFLAHMAKISVFVLASFIIYMWPAIIGLSIGYMLDSLTPALIGAALNIPYALAITSFDWPAASSKVERIMSRKDASE